MTLIPTLKQRLASPDCLVDISSCGLEGIEDQGSSVRIGAMTKHVTVAESSSVAKAIPALADLAGGIGDRQVFAIEVRLEGQSQTMTRLPVILCSHGIGCNSSYK